ncbi:MAG: hypothetical protein HP043_03345 [Dialister sp.]|nr:hypothetical protein [Dialister sp.]
MSTTNEADKIPVLYVEKKEKGTLTITATPEPGAEWPVDGETKYPIWSGSGGAVDSKDPAKYVLALDTAGSYTISASCGNTVSVKVVVIDIIIKEGGTVVSDGKVHEKIAGEKIALTAEIQPSDIQYDELVGWNISGTVLADYDVSNPRQPHTVDLLPAALKNLSVSYYWVTGENAAGASFSIKVNDQTFAKQADFKVIKPSTAFSAKTSGISIIYRDNQYDLIFAMVASGKTYQGIQFSYVSDSNVNGTYGYFQKINSTYRRIDHLDSTTLPKIIQASNVGDVGIPYPFISDSPAVGATEKDSQITVNDSFTTWLMFKSSKADSIWIPLRSLDWSWSASMKLDVGIDWEWKLIYAMHDQNPSSSETTVFPQWNGLSGDLKL